jgi:uncharacterized membrane protein YkvA (DUF1232 family)
MKDHFMQNILQRWKQVARLLKVEIYALYLAYRDERTPWYARVFVACVVGYAFSPIDLIPDFIPILGYLDDLILLPLGIKIALTLIPEAVMAESRKRAHEITDAGKPVNYFAAIVIVLIWLTSIGLLMVYLRRIIS